MSFSKVKLIFNGKKFKIEKSKRSISFLAVKYIKDNGTTPISTEQEFSLTMKAIYMKVISKMEIAMG
tara:strand:+ start:858 stop:1058 length:201 start_codon:yes stop_codon:yes gene_type:complete